MEKRYTQPTLIWALAQDYAAKKWPAREIGQSDLQLNFYPTDGEGYWLMHSPKLYFREKDTQEQYFSNCPQTALADNEIGEVVLINRMRKQTIVLGHTLADAVSELRGGKRGRPPLSPGETEYLSIRIPGDLKARIPEPISDFVRQAIEEKLKGGDK